MSNCSVWPLDGTLSGATTSGQSGSESNSNEGVLHIPQSSSITWISPSNHGVMSRIIVWVEGDLPLGRDAVGIV